MIDITSTELFCSTILYTSEFLENDEVGMLVNAAKNYMYKGVEPSFKTKALKYAWSRVRLAFAKPTIEEAPKKRGRKPKSEKNIKEDYVIPFNTDDVTRNTAGYIDYFLTSNDEFKKLTASEKWTAIQMNRYNVNEYYIRHCIRTMDYHEFLQTPWWDAIRSYKRLREDNTCEKCGCTDKTLHIHHPNYEIRGYEDKYIDTLQCLCEDCHKEAHNKKKEIDEDFIKSIMLD